MSIQKYIKENIGLLGAKTYTAPDIPNKKLNAAISSYASEVNLDYVVGLKDASILSTGKEGCLFLGDAVYLKAPFEKLLRLEYESIDSIEYDTNIELTKFGKEKEVESLKIVKTDETSFDISKHLLNVNQKGFEVLINGILNEAANGQAYENTSQVMPLSEMPDHVKKNYIKIVANYAYSDDQAIDAENYTEIVSLISRIELDSKSRIEIRAYLTDINTVEPSKSLLADLEEELKEESFSVLGKSLYKDVLYLFATKEDMSSWQDNTYLTELAEDLSITDEEINIIIEAIKNDEDILKHRKNDSQIKKSMKDVSAKAAAVGLPMAAIYFSGSVAGLSAAGITSGLATMGMGGLLGFSSMFTGIGTLVLLGVGTYHGLKIVSGIGDVENNKQREFMLQAIIRNSQQSLSYLIKDINAISQQLVDEMKKGNENSDKIHKLSHVLNMLSKGAQISAEKQNISQIEQMITKLPAVLNAGRLNELTNKPTLQKVREFILSCYEETNFTEEVKGELTEKVEFRLKEGLTLEEVETLYDFFVEIDYNKVAQAAFATTADKAKSFFKGKE